MTTFLAATLPVATIAAESVGVLGAAIGRVRGVFGFRPFPGAQSSMSAMAPTASSERIAASFMGGTMLRIDGAPVHPFADLSGFFRASDGWVRTHANYAHHRTALLDAVGLDGDCDTERFAGRVAGITAAELEWSCSNSGALAVQVRTEDQWSAHPAGEAARSGPLIERTDAGAASLDRIPVFRGGTYAAPLAGVRVLDLTRVIAGPVATRALALFGADVLRIDPPQLPEIAWQHLENGQGKRSASVDLNTRAGLVRVQRLLDSADVLVTGYRPGALERFGLEHRGGVVHGRISAWGTRGPWSDRRGFDSLVQAATGISILEGRGELGRLPAQALDHASGYLLAAGIVSELADRADGSGSNAAVEVSLARTAAWLMELPGRDPSHGSAGTPSADCVVTHGRVTTARPVFDEYADYPFPAHPWGTDDADWT